MEAVLGPAGEETGCCTTEGKGSAHPGAPDPKTRSENGHGAGHFLITL